VSARLSVGGEAKQIGNRKKTTTTTITTKRQREHATCTHRRRDGGVKFAICVYEDGDTFCALLLLSQFARKDGREEKDRKRKSDSDKVNGKKSG